MSNLDDDIRKASPTARRYDLDREEGVFRQWAGIYRGKMRWMAVFATAEAVVFAVLIVLAAIQFFQTDEQAPDSYATFVLLATAAGETARCR